MIHWSSTLPHWPPSLPAPVCVDWSGWRRSLVRMHSAGLTALEWKWLHNDKAKPQIVYRYPRLFECEWAMELFHSTVDKCRGNENSRKNRLGSSVGLPVASKILLQTTWIILVILLMTWPDAPLGEEGKQFAHLGLHFTAVGKKFRLLFGNLSSMVRLVDYASDVLCVS